MDLNNRNTGFVMIGAREVNLIGAGHFENQIEAIENAVEENPGFVFSLSKTLIETTCKTILNDRKQTINPKWDMPQLFRETLKTLQLVSEDIDDSTKISKSIKKTVNGLITTIQGICELRTLQGIASHGQDAYFKQLDDFHARFIARSADVVISFLFRVHRKYPVDVSIRRLIYSGMSDYNNWIDEQNESVKIFKYEYKPSEVLFIFDKIAYRDLLSDYETDELPEENPTDNNVQGSNVNE